MPSESPLEIREATEADVPDIVECLQLAFETIRAVYPIEAFRQTALDADSLRKRMETLQVLVAERSGAIVGTIACGSISGVGTIRGMAVVPTEQGTGVAALLLERAVRGLADSGCRKILLGTTAHQGRAMHFYERRGFRRTGQVSDFLGIPLHEFELVLDD